MSNLSFSPDNEGNSFKQKSNFSSGEPNIFNKPNYFTSSSNLSVLYTNADVLTKNKLTELKDMALTMKAQIIVVTEVSPKNSIYEVQISSYNINNYDIFTNIPSKGRGIILYIHQELKASEVASDIVFDESVWCELNLHNKDKLIIGCIYIEVLIMMYKM